MQNKIKHSDIFKHTKKENEKALSIFKKMQSMADKLIPRGYTIIVKLKKLDLVKKNPPKKYN